MRLNVSVWIPNSPAIGVAAWNWNEAVSDKSFLSSIGLRSLQKVARIQEEKKHFVARHEWFLFDVGAFFCRRSR